MTNLATQKLVRVDSLPVGAKFILRESDVFSEEFIGCIGVVKTLLTDDEAGKCAFNGNAQVYSGIGGLVPMVEPLDITPDPVRTALADCVDALKCAISAMHNQYCNKPRIGMEEPYAKCESALASARKALGSES